MPFAGDRVAGVGTLARGNGSDDLDERLAWASREFVHGYYRSVAREIDEDFGQRNGPDP